MRKFGDQKRLAIWMAAIITAYIALADWVIAPLHTRGWFSTLFSCLDSLSALLQFPGFMVVQTTRIRDGHHTTTGVWFIILIVNAVMWAVMLRLFLRVLFPASGSGSGVPPERSGETPKPLELTSRRRFLVHSGRLAVASAAGVAAWSVLFEPRWFGVTHRTFALRGLPPELDGLRVVQLTDIHLGPNLSVEYVREVIAATNALKADLILLTGDYVHRSPSYIEPVVRELSELRAKIGVIGTLGNHDWWEDGPATQRAFARAGLPLIDNSRLFLTPDRRLVPYADRGLCIAGIGDYNEDVVEFDRALGNVPADIPRLLLSHNPDAAEDTRFVGKDLRVDLMLCGHTHGGQVWIPGLGTPIVPSRFGQKYASGLVQGPACPVFISRGIGMTILPMRFCVPPEVVAIEFKCA